MVALSKEGLTASYTYDESGLRTSKTINGITTEYYWNGSQLLGQKTGNSSLYFLYDERGLLVGFNDGTRTYLYTRNLQGDIVSITDTATEQTVATYTYDSWGNVLTATGAMAEVNPFRYRGYYYDSETGLYALQSRYYDPQTGRFLNLDELEVLTATPKDLTDKNLYAYCDNNPIVRGDKDGEFWNFIIGAVVGAVAGAVTQVISNAVSGKKLTDGLATATLSGAASGLLAASGVGIVGSVVGNAAISMASNATNQIIENKGFNNFDVGDMLIDGTIGGIAGAVGGAGMGKTVRLGTLNKNLTKKIVSRSAQAIQKGIKYYISQTKNLYKKQLLYPIFKGGAAALAGYISKEMLSGCSE